MECKRILMPINPEGEETPKLVDVGLMLAKQFNAEIYFVSILSNENKKSIGKVRKDIEGYAGEYSKQGVRTSYEVMESNDGQEELPLRIMELSGNCDMLVVGHRKYDKILRFLHQSTAQDLINLVSCPVVIVPD